MCILSICCSLLCLRAVRCLYRSSIVQRCVQIQHAVAAELSIQGRKLSCCFQKNLPDIGKLQIRAIGIQHCRRTGHHGGRHGGAGHEAVSAICDGADDISTRCCDIHTLCPIIGALCQISVKHQVRCRNHIIQVEGRGIIRFLIRILPDSFCISVSGRYHKQHFGIPHHLLQLRIILRGAKTEIADGGSIGFRIADGLDDSLFLSHTVPGSKCLEHHNLNIVVVRDTCNTAISAGRSDGACRMGAMVILSALAEFIVSVKKIPAVNIIYITVPVIVNAISRNLVFVGPDCIFQIRMTDINSGINHCNDHVTVFLRAGVVKVPRWQNVNIYTSSRPYLLNTVSIRSGYRSWHAKIICQINVVCQLRITVAEAVCDLTVLQLRIIFQSPLVSGIAV